MMATSEIKLQVKPFSWQDKTVQMWQNWAAESALTPFAFPTFQKIFSHFLETGYEAVLLGVWRETDLVAVLSGHRRDQTFWLAGMPDLFGSATVTDYGDMVVAPQVANKPDICQLIWQSLRQYLQQQGLTKLQLDNLRPDSYLAQGLPLSTDAAILSEVSPYLLIPADWETYLAQLRKKDRSELRRKLKRLEMVDPSYSFESTSPENIADFVRLHRLSDPAKAQFMTAKMAEVFEQLATAKYEGEWQWQFGFLTIDNQRVASVAYFMRPGDRILLYNSGYDPAFSHLSVGLAIKAELVKLAITHQCQEYDFLRGSERYKYDLGAQSRQLYQMCYDFA